MDIPGLLVLGHPRLGPGMCDGGIERNYVKRLQTLLIITYIVRRKSYLVNIMANSCADRVSFMLLKITGLASSKIPGHY